MEAVRVVARAAFRHHRRAHLAIVLVIGLTMGVALVVGAGARRTLSAYDRFLESANVSTLTSSSAGAYDEAVNERIGALPSVRSSATTFGVEVRVLRDGVPDPAQDAEGSASRDGRFETQDRMTIVDGRAADQRRADELVVNRRAAERFGYRVGQELDIAWLTDEEVGSPDLYEQPVADDQRRTVTVVGIGILPEEVLQDEYDVSPRMFLTQAYADEVPPALTYGIQGLVLEDGDGGIAPFRHELADAGIDPSQLSVFRVTSADAFHARQALRPLAIALALFALVAAAAGVVLGAQAVDRAVRAERPTAEVLRALGTPPGVTVTATVVGPLAAAVAGVALATVVAVAASPSMPIGPIRDVEPDPGIAIDWTVLGLGGLVTVLLLAAVAVQSARGRAATTWSRRIRTDELLRGTNLGPAFVTGVREAFGARSVAAGAVVAVASLVAALTFGASLRNLVDEPALYGWNADLVALSGLGYSNFEVDGTLAALDEAGVVDWTGAYFGTATLDGVDVDALAIEPGGAASPPLMSGRALESEDEIVLGAETARRLGVGVGDSVTIESRDGPAQVRVVGLATMPTIGRLHASHPSLGVGAVVAPSILPGLDRDILGEISAEPLGPQALFIRTPPGAHEASTAAALTEALRFPAGFAGIDILQVQRPAEIVNAGSLGSSPLVLAGCLAAGALASLAVAVGSSVRRRRSELGVLKAIGFTRRQLAATAAWHATATAVIGLVVGIPAGAILGGVLWRRFAAQLDVVEVVVVPMAAVALVVVAAVALVNLVASVPARAAARVTSSSALRLDG